MRSKRRLADGGVDRSKRVGQPIRNLPIEPVGKDEVVAGVRQRQSGVGSQTVPEPSREVDVESGDIHNWTVSKLVRLLDWWRDAAKRSNIDDEEGLLDF